MKGWQLKRIDELGNIITGKTPSSNNPDEFGFEYPFITPTDMHAGKKVIVERFLSEKGKEKHNRIKLPRKTTCVVCIASVGKVCMTSKLSFSNQQINSIIPNKENDPDFVYYLATTLNNGLIAFAGGTATPIINKSAFSSIKVLVPNYEKQRKIAAVLSAYDDLIENNNRRIAILEKMAEELYREWFVRLRFPGHDSIGYRHACSLHKGIPEGWEVKTVEQSFEYLGGGTPSTLAKGYWQDGDINWYSPTDLTAYNAVFAFQSKQQITEQGLKESSARMFPAYSIMMTSRATIGQISINTTPACTNQGFITCIPNDKVPLYFLYYWLELNKDYFIQIANGATFLELTKGKFKNVNILIPPARITELYSKMQRPIFEHLELLLRQRDNLTTFRDRLLSRLMSGKIDVEHLDIAFPKSMMNEADAELVEAPPSMQEEVPFHA